MTVTLCPVCDQVPFQPWASCWLPGVGVAQRPGRQRRAQVGDGDRHAEPGIPLAAHGVGHRAPRRRARRRGPGQGRAPSPAAPSTKRRRAKNRRSLRNRIARTSGSERSRAPPFSPRHTTRAPPTLGSLERPVKRCPGRPIRHRPRIPPEGQVGAASGPVSAPVSDRNCDPGGRCARATFIVSSDHHHQPGLAADVLDAGLLPTCRSAPTSSLPAPHRRHPQRRELRREPEPSSGKRAMKPPTSPKPTKPRRNHCSGYQRRYKLISTILILGGGRGWGS